MEKDKVAFDAVELCDVPVVEAIFAEASRILRTCPSLYRRMWLKAVHEREGERVGEKGRGRVKGRERKRER